ncbi:MAG: Allophanate hydrolase 2 subunit 1 [Candidatus Carbobacillus altaicus]|uniref:Allophanate hydrolase 2 subunit 1 n=1 Tax=Candidatus Carbonibacillus altaicus TaxID=2163959 RepID=A0A2R6XX73_9BACL|nr:MAG: Allophanate hydrolase 2 subunit 1 [Candidatus Carbobacillus altaicus]
MHPFDPLSDIALHVVERLKAYMRVIERFLDDHVEEQLVEIPVHYGGKDGPDLIPLAEEKGLTPDEVIELHSSTVYTVAMIGFMPGFPYLEGLPDILASTRLPVPRLKVPAGSVGIGGSQTGLYPFESPGGWRIIGRTDAVLFDVRRNPPARFKMGDRVRFIPVKK